MKHLSIPDHGKETKCENTRICFRVQIYEYSATYFYFRLVWRRWLLNTLD